jgi:hypothetical protein
MSRSELPDHKFVSFAGGSRIPPTLTSCLLWTLKEPENTFDVFHLLELPTS